ncbi:hypothetical protein, partial [Streptomyces sp. NPDC051776]|uniref:hypothetical protein n=1 Tax=Streptomyces sp. NPDC051776 TaxID=3155414 RepID=UPI0034257A1D
TVEISSVNRRMRARMSGGVRGGPGDPALLLDPVRPGRCRVHHLHPAAGLTEPMARPAVRRANNRVVAIATGLYVMVDTIAVSLTVSF